MAAAIAITAGKRFGRGMTMTDKIIGALSWLVLCGLLGLSAYLTNLYVGGAL